MRNFYAVAYSGNESNPTVAVTMSLNGGGAFNDGIGVLAASASLAGGTVGGYGTTFPLSTVTVTLVN